MDRVETGMAGIEVCQHQILNTLIELDGDRANVEACFFSLHVLKGSSVEEHVYVGDAGRAARRDARVTRESRHLPATRRFQIAPGLAGRACAMHGHPHRQAGKGRE